MSLYKLGLSIDRTSTVQLTSYQKGLITDERVGGFQFWRGVKTPSMIRDEIERILNEWITTGKDLISQLKREGAYPDNLADRPDDVIPLVEWYRDVWTPAYIEMEAFRNRHQSWRANLWGDTWDDAQTFQRQLIALRKKAREMGFALKTSPEPVEQPDNSLSAGLSALFWTIIKFSLIGGALYLAFLFLSKKIGA